MPSGTRRSFLAAAGGLPLAWASMALPGSRTAAGAAITGRPVVRTAEGDLRGIETPELRIFKGIRYGEPTPRFHKPVPVRPWKGVRDAVTLGHPCYQRNIDTSPWQDPMPESEDCLFLNVWSPAGKSALPVMVWIHGGAFWWGSGGLPIYDGASLAQREDVVVVTLNHRLNLFGYLYLDGLDAGYSGTANLGQLDLVEALKWVRSNIAAFGGDPANVTIFGESGGGGKVNALLAMPAAKGLFKKAIVQSCSSYVFKSREDATEEARAALAELGIKPADAALLRTVPPARLMAAYDAIRAKSGKALQRIRPFSPVQERSTLPWQCTDPRALALWRNVPLLIGTTEQETAYTLSLSGAVPAIGDDDALVSAIVKMVHGLDAPRARALVVAYRARMPQADRRTLLVAVTTGLWMEGGATMLAGKKAGFGGAPTYLYRFGWKEPFLNGEWALHGADIAFVFDKADMPSLLEEGVDMRALRARLDPASAYKKVRDMTMATWGSFARSGNPANSHLPAWPRYGLSARPTMRLDASPAVVNDPLGPDIRALLQS